jgi:hypothetical protein
VTRGRFVATNRRGYPRVLLVLVRREMPAMGWRISVNGCMITDYWLARPCGLLVGLGGGFDHASPIQAATQQSDRLHSGRDRCWPASHRDGSRCGLHPVIGGLTSGPSRSKKPLPTASATSLDQLYGDVMIALSVVSTSTTLAGDVRTVRNGKGRSGYSRHAPASNSGVSSP